MAETNACEPFYITGGCGVEFAIESPCDCLAYSGCHYLAYIIIHIIDRLIEKKQGVPGPVYANAAKHLGLAEKPSWERTDEEHKKIYDRGLAMYHDDLRKIREAMVLVEDNIHSAEDEEKITQGLLALAEHFETLWY